MPVSGQSLTRLPVPDAFMPSIPLPSLRPTCRLRTASLAALLMLAAPLQARDVATEVERVAATADAAASSAAASAGVLAAGTARSHHADARVQREQQRSQAQAALHRKRPAQALAIAEEALAQAPGDARLRFLKGVALNQLGRLDEAEDVFRALVDEYPELPEPHNNLAVVLAAQGRLEDARLALEGAIQAVPNHAIAHENLGNLYLQLARRNWQRAHTLAPGNAALARRLKALDAIDVPASTAP